MDNPYTNRSSRVSSSTMRPGLACYRDGEQASVEYVLKNFHEA